MTTITSATATPTGDWIKPVEELAREQHDGLHRLANMILTRPEVAPLFEGMLRNLINPVDGVGLKTLADATAGVGGHVSAAKLGGLDLGFSPAVEVWGMTDAPPEPTAVETGPEAHDEVPDDEPGLDETQAMEIPADDDVPAETVAEVAS